MRLKAVTFNNEKFIVDMVKGTVKRENGEYVVNDTVLKESVIELACK